ncbi:MAG TPA: SPFH domain-containing protein [Candidatus Elarobacter sp.]|nr:SPFH domain-containing protein [Candidatus Elarobacter sp.]
MTTTIGASVGVIVGIVVVAFALFVVIFRAMWRVAEPNEALIISGLHHRPNEETGDSLGFKIVTGRGTLVIPGVQTVRRLSLDLRESELQIACVTQQGIPVHIKGVVIYKVGDDFVSIANAARRFLDQQDRMDQRIQQVFAGHLRAICGSLTVEDLIRERDKLTEATRGASGTEMEKLGLIVDSLQIQEIDDPTGYIENLAKPHAAAVQRDARIAGAQADQEATQREQEAAALKAQAQRDSKIKQAGYQAEVDKAAAQAKQAGPLADAMARQQVVVEETKIVELDAHKKEQELLVTVRRPADAQAYEKTTLATAQRDADIASAEARAKQIELQAQADATRIKLAADADSQKTKMIGEAEGAAIRARGTAEGDAINARGLAEAAAIKARAEALAQNQEAVIAQQLAEHWPAIVEAGSKAFSNIDQMIVMNGADGVSEMLAKVVTQGVAGMQMARNLLARTKSGSDFTTPPAPNGEGAIVKTPAQVETK